MLTLWITTLCLAVVYSDITRKVYIDLCKNEVIQQFKIIPPGKCINKGNATKIYPVRVFKPFNQMYNLGAKACRMTIDTHNCIHYLFGSNVCNLVRTEHQLVTKKECELWEQRHFTSVGRLLPRADGSMTTKNILEPIYGWFGNLIEVKNVELNYLTITKNVVTEELHHISLGKLFCNRKFKTCTAGNWRINYVEPREKTCETIPRSDNKTLTIHKTSKGNLFELDETNLIVSNLMKCSPKSLACIKQKKKSRFFCTMTNHVLEIPEESNIEPIGTADDNIPASLRNIQATMTSIAHGSFLNSENLRNYFKLVTCEMARANIVALMGSQSLNPSQVLSYLLEREVQAIFTGGVLRELRCSKVQAVLQPNLYYKGHVSDRPLFVAYTGTEAKLTSLRQGRFLTEKISSTVTPTKRKTFSFNNSLIIYKNNTLIDQIPALKKITIKNVELEEKNFDILEENLNEDLQEVSWSEEDVTQQQLKNLLLITKEEYISDGINIEELLAETHTMDYNNVRAMLEKIKYSIWKKIKNILELLGHIYTIIATILIVVVIIQTLREKCGKKPNEGDKK